MGGPSYRLDPVGSEDYWRQTVADLTAGGTAAATVGGPNLPNGIIFPDNSAPLQQQTTAVVSVGPQSIGERWDVSLVQVQTGSQAGQPPLVIQQVAAQAAGKTLTPPPPIVARVWRAVGGIPVHLLGVTSQGGYDTLGISCPTLAAGETILVVWYGAPKGDTAQVIIKGTKYALST